MSRRSDIILWLLYIKKLQSCIFSFAGLRHTTCGSYSPYKIWLGLWRHFYGFKIVWIRLFDRISLNWSAVLALLFHIARGNNYNTLFFFKLELVENSWTILMTAFSSFFMREVCKITSLMMAAIVGPVWWVPFYLLQTKIWAFVFVVSHQHIWIYTTVRRLQ